MKTVRMTALRALAAVVFSGVFWLGTQKAHAHCDSLGGPVLIEAKAALDKGDVTPLLKWIPKADEGEIRTVFAQAVAVRAKGNDARELADRFFFETLVRVHRAGEGAPYTGLKSADTTAPAVASADKALDVGSVDALSSKIGSAVRDGIRERFADVMEKKKHVNDSVEAGREYVAAYVEYVHFVEGIHNMVVLVALGAGECELVARDLASGRWRVAVPGFGSSDCRTCPAHLLVETTSGSRDLPSGSAAGDEAAASDARKARSLALVDART